METIINVARTGPEGTIGDGKIFVIPADEAIQINDGAQRAGSRGINDPGAPSFFTVFLTPASSTTGAPALSSFSGGRP